MGRYNALTTGVGPLCTGCIPGTYTSNLGASMSFHCSACGQGMYGSLSGASLSLACTVCVRLHFNSVPHSSLSQLMHIHTSPPPCLFHSNLALCVVHLGCWQVFGGGRSKFLHQLQHWRIRYLGGLLLIDRLHRVCRGHLLAAARRELVCLLLRVCGGPVRDASRR